MFRPGLWSAFNTSFYTGGRTKVSDVANFELQQNSRVGGTLSIPLDQRRSLKFSYSAGAHTTIGADFHAFGAGYQVLWGGGL